MTKQYNVGGSVQKMIEAITPQKLGRFNLVIKNVGGLTGFEFVERVVLAERGNCAATNLVMDKGVVVRRVIDGVLFTVGEGVAKEYLSVEIPKRARKSAKA